MLPKKTDFNLLSVVLFGSLAKGTDFKKSDIDLFILVPSKNKYDEIIFNAFFSSEGLWKSGTADYRRKDMRRERLKLIRSMHAKIKELINELIRLNFGDVDVEFTFITDLRPFLAIILSTYLIPSGEYLLWISSL